MDSTIENNCYISDKVMNAGDLPAEKTDSEMSDVPQLDNDMPLAPGPLKRSASTASSEDLSGSVRPSRSCSPHNRSSKKTPSQHSLPKGVAAAARLASNQGPPKKK